MKIESELLQKLRSMNRLAFVGAPYTGKSTLMKGIDDRPILDIGDEIRKNYPELACNDDNPVEDIIKVIQNSEVGKTVEGFGKFGIGKIILPDLAKYLGRHGTEFVIVRFGGPITYQDRNREENIEERCRNYYKKYSEVEDFILKKYSSIIVYRDEKGFYY